MNILKRIMAWFRKKPETLNIPKEALDEAWQDATRERILVLRSLSKMNKDAKQGRMYAPCACGSGKKFKFCCNGKEK